MSDEEIATLAQNDEVLAYAIAEEAALEEAALEQAAMALSDEEILALAHGDEGIALALMDEAVALAVGDDAGFDQLNFNDNLFSITDPVAAGNSPSASTVSPPGWAIALIVIASIVLVALIVVQVLLFRRLRN